MFYIVNYTRWENYKKPFDNFKDAFMIQQLKMPDAKIEEWDGYTKKLAWNPRWENHKGKVDTKRINLKYKVNGQTHTFTNKDIK